MKMEAETGGLRPRAQGHLEPPEAVRGRKDPPLESSQPLGASSPGEQKCPQEGTLSTCPKPSWLTHLS